MRTRYTYPAFPSVEWSEPAAQRCSSGGRLQVAGVMETSGHVVFEARHGRGCQKPGHRARRSSGTRSSRPRTFSGGRLDEECLDLLASIVWAPLPRW